MALEPSTGPSDEADLVLIERFAHGQGAAYDAIVRKYQSRVAGLAYRLLAWPGDVEDVVQEVFLAAFRGLPRFDRRASLSTWLTRITINTCRSHRRRRLLSFRRLFGPGPSRPVPPPSEAAPPSDRPAIDRERFEQVRRAIDRLPARYREVVVLRYLEQLSVEQIGEVLSAQPATIGVRLHRARKLLRDRLADLAEE